MKRIICVLLALSTMVLLFTGCGKKERLLYNDVKLSKCVEIPEYKGLKIDTSSKDFTTIEDSLIDTDIQTNGFYVLKNDGYVANGDNVNIDYVGEKDGVAFEGGTAEGYDLVIGSNSFIDGFESGLIGAEIGKTIDLNLKFPEGYQEESLAGADVVFTVTVNYVTTNIQLKPEEYFSELGFKSVDEYKKDVKDRAIESYILEILAADTTVKEYPEKDMNYIYEVYKGTIEAQNGVAFSELLAYYGQTEESFKAEFLEQQIKPIMKNQMIVYAIFDEEKLSFTSEEVENEVKATIAQSGNSGISQEQIKKLYGDFYFEQNVVRGKVMKFLIDNAKIS